MENSTPLGFIAVHVGAGFHSPSNSDLHKKICRQAILQAVKLLRQRRPAMEALQAAMLSLENSPFTNAGIGSNLTLTGTVECDASIMDGRTLQYGAVGAVSGVQNPILIAANLLQMQLLGNFSLGRIPPSTMVGQGAYDWAVRQGIQTVPETALITERSKETYLQNKRKLDHVEEKLEKARNGHPRRKARKLNKDAQKVSSTDGTVDSDTAQKDRFHDTIGAVCMDHTGNVVSAVSSGGILLKQPGRLGQAAMFACGCWSENDDNLKTGIGISTSGTGEHLTKTLLARTCADRLKLTDDPTYSLSNVFHKEFLDSPFLKGTPRKYGGALALKADYSNPLDYTVEVLWAHTTESMCLAYMAAGENHLEVLVSRLPEENKSGQTCLVQSECFSLTKTTFTEDSLASTCDNVNKTI